MPEKKPVVKHSKLTDEQKKQIEDHLAKIQDILETHNIQDLEISNINANTIDPKRP